MPYRNPDIFRNRQQTEIIHRYAGQTAVWRQYISANPPTGDGVAAGFGVVTNYREQVVTGVFGGGDAGGGVMSTNQQEARAAGTIAGGMVRMVSNVQMHDQDEVIWQGITYRVDTDSQPAIMAGSWQAILTRAEE